MSESYVFEKVSQLMDEGEYEVRIEKVERKMLPSGKEKLQITYRVRDDVEQKYQNRCVFEDIWAERENPEMFNRKRINQLLGTQAIEDGHTFDSINDVINFLLGCNLVVHISVEFDEYRNENVNNVSYYRSSKAKNQTIDTEMKPIIESGDIPF